MYLKVKSSQRDSSPAMFPTHTVTETRSLSFADRVLVAGGARFFLGKQTKIGSIYLNSHKNIKWPLNIPKWQLKYQLAMKYFKNFRRKSSKIYSNWHFWYENKIYHLATLLAAKSTPTWTRQYRWKSIKWVPGLHKVSRVARFFLIKYTKMAMM
jgi:hypothetical protein